MAEHQTQELLVFGATGGTGQALVHAALERNYRVTAFVRDTDRAQHLFSDVRSQITFSEGDALNESDVQRAVGANFHAVVSAMGIYQKAAGNDELTRATANIIAAMRATGPRRLICISSIGVGDSRNQGNFVARLMQKTTLKHTLADKEAQEALINDSGLDWTVIRPSRLLKKGGPKQYASWVGAQPNEKLSWAISRANVAKFSLECLADDATIGKALNLTGK